MPVSTKSLLQLGSEQITRSSQFWFSDGNIILVAESVGFKVHRGQLARHSEVFDGLFSIPQPPTIPLIDDCQCVEIYDKPSDVAAFLSALYDGMYMLKPCAFDFSMISGVLRLSTKYCVDHLRKQCLIRLQRDWPATLASWDRREKLSTDANGHYAPREYFPHPILIIELAIELNIPSILPAALYDLARYGPSKIMAGTLAPIPTPVPPQPVISESPIQVISLSHDLLVTTLRGREAGQQYIADFIARDLRDRPLSADCVNKNAGLEYGISNGDAGRLGINECYESFYYIMLNMLRSVGGIACGRDADPLYTLDQAIEMLSRQDFSDGSEGGRKCGLKMCDGCKVEFEKCAKNSREEVWSLIPAWFGLDHVVLEEVDGIEY